jgi:integral membrane protein (TIGR01906 family)
MTDQPLLRKIVQGVVPLLVLLLLLLTGIRLLLTNTFVRLEYSMPNFPEDLYGMTKAERLTYAPIALEFLLNGADESFLGDLTFEDGSPMFNERELSHMVDVQVLTGYFLRVWVVSILLMASIGIWAWRGAWWEEFKVMLSNGGLFTIILLGTLILLLLLSFDLVFVGFHRIFFEGDSWLFLYSDTLIRLFPERFWQDAFILVGVFTLAGGLALWRVFRQRPAE